MSDDKLTDTLFLRNLAYDTEQDELKQLFEQFGQLEYCLICKDKETGESKGTGFVKFKDAQVAGECLTAYKDFEQQSKFHLDGRNIVVLPALSREDVSSMQNKEKQRDKRNLYLAREGAILPNSEPAEGMSKDDLKKRMALEERKRKLLTNLHYFVSDTRLCVHNLPSNFDDVKLRKLMLDAADKQPSVKIIECRVMKNKKGKDTSNAELGKSKGFAFVEFSKPEHALMALRKLNNNPHIFSADRRPIVEFSLENRVALNKKKVRLIKSLRTLDQKGQLKRKEVLQQVVSSKKKSKSKIPSHLEPASNNTEINSAPVETVKDRKKKFHRRGKAHKRALAAAQQTDAENVTTKTADKKSNKKTPPIAAPKYGGVMARPPKPNEPVRVPKLNRKFWNSKAEALKKDKKTKKTKQTKKKAKVNV